MSASPYAPDDLVAGVLTIRLNVNAMNKLMALLSFVQADENVNVIVLREEGEQFGVSLGATDTEGSHQLVQRLRDLPQPIVAMVPGQIHDQALAALQACDIVLATGQDDWATLSFPASELEEQTYKLARELASKDPLILRFTKKTVRQVASIAWDDILSFTTAQQAEIKSLQAGRPSPRALAIESFLAGKSKPGAGA
jgi:enoyl-CoA hydratase/carnithine racemase